MKIIDKQLNYGRHVVRAFLRRSLPFERVMDIGAGEGMDLSIASSVSPSAKLYAVEVFPQNVNKLKKQGVSVFPIDIEKESFPLDDGFVDVIIANQILEHTKEIFWIFHEVTRVLPVGGKLILGVPNLASLHNRILLLAGKQPSPIKSNSAHVRGFTKGDIVNFMESCFPGGYKLLNFGGSNFYPFPPLIAKPLANAFPSMAWGIFFLFEKQLPYSGEFVEFPRKVRLETNFFLGD